MSAGKQSTFQGNKAEPDLGDHLSLSPTPLEDRVGVIMDPITVTVSRPRLPKTLYLRRGQ